jgi:hypothetical protein
MVRVRGRGRVRVRIAVRVVVPLLYLDHLQRQTVGEWTPEGNGIGHTHSNTLSRAGVGTNGILECKT